MGTADSWVLVADHARARLFALDAGHLEEISDFVNAEARIPGHERLRAPPPRVHDRFGASRHAMQAHTLPQDKAAARFALALQSVLERGRTARSYGNLVLIAPPRFLGVLNAALGRELDERVALRIDKNLTWRKPGVIRGMLPRSLLRPLKPTTGRASRTPANVLHATAARLRRKRAVWQ